MTVYSNHKMGPSGLNHGNLQCQYCKATDLEIKYIGSTCPNAPDTQIWKLQRPLMSTGSMTEILIYNEDRSALGRIEVGQQWIDQYFGSSPKIYVRGYQNEAGQLAFQPSDIIVPEEWPAW